MPAEHLRENGDLSQGYYCSICGQPCAMYGHQPGYCQANSKLVNKLNRINEAGSIEAYTFNKLQGKYDD